MPSNRSSSPASVPPLKEMAQATHVEKGLSGAVNDQGRHPDELSPEEHKKVFRKIDIRLMPMLMVLYLIANLDR